jgi:molybdopterin-guanine dinucleotide biosynthesis protein A
MLPLSVAILCGGASRRMGVDKALLLVQSGGPTMLETVIKRVRDLSDDVFLVGRDRPGFAVAGIPLIVDREPGQGPLAGIATALAACRYSHCLVVGCDMPLLSRPLLAAMAALPQDTYDALVPLVAANAGAGAGQPDRQVHQSLHAIYSRTCLPAIERRLDRGDRRVTSFYPDVRVQVVDPAFIQAHDPRLRSFFSVNTPVQLIQARAWLAAEVAGTYGDLLYSERKGL